MNEIVITQHGDRLTVSSVQVAADFGKKHKNVVQSIENLIEQTSAENSANLFIASTYCDNYGRGQKCYDLTRDGFCLLVMGFTGKDALEWKLKYIEAFNKMEQHILSQADEIQHLEAQAKRDRAIAMRLNAENRRMKMLLDHPEMDKLSPIALEVLGLKRFEDVTGRDVGNALPTTEQTYSATQAGEMLGGISAAKIGSTANKNGLKTEEYGVFVMDKSRYSAKEVSTFRYNMRGVKKLGEILGRQVRQ